ncbi:MAG: hypothetical protein IVW36_00580 [Dehalococcoidia bacterium]|nr:hypothetical protein [Dehalococcoidia bacterium]
MRLEPITGTPVRLPPGRVAVRLGARYRLPYQRLYQRYQTQLTNLPVLRASDFDGRTVKLTPAQLEALNDAFAAYPEPSDGAAGGVFDAQERGRTELFKRTQFLS